MSNNILYFPSPVNKEKVLLVDDAMEYDQGTPLFKYIERGLKKFVSDKMTLASAVTMDTWLAQLQARQVPGTVIHDFDISSFGKDCPFDVWDSILTFRRKGSRVIFYSANSPEEISHEINREIQRRAEVPARSTPFALAHGLECNSVDIQHLRTLPIMTKGKIKDLCELIRENNTIEETPRNAVAYAL